MRGIEMRFAICISGAFRANYKLALDSIYENLVNPLNADVFIETWDNYFEWPGMCGGNFVQRLFGDDIYKITPLCLSTEKLFKSKLPNTYKKLLNPIVSKLKINSITENYNVVQISLNSENSFNNNILSKMDTTGVYIPNQYKMFYLLFKANEQMRLHEKNLTVPYDIVIRVRPDVVFEEKVDTKRFYEIDDNCALMKWVYPNSDGVYWGVDDAEPNIDAYYGVNAIIVNTEKGEKIINGLNDNCDFKRTNLGFQCFSATSFARHLQSFSGLEAFL